MEGKAKRKMRYGKYDGSRDHQKGQKGLGIEKVLRKLKKEKERNRKERFQSGFKFQDPAQFKKTKRIM